MKKATRAIYPLSSRIDRKKNMVTITGRKLSTLPTPSNRPFRTRLWIASLTFASIIQLPVASAMPSMPD